MLEHEGISHPTGSQSKELMTVLGDKAATKLLQCTPSTQASHRLSWLSQVDSSRQAAQSVYETFVNMLA